VCTAGCPSPPTITSEEYSREKYSYDLTWTVLSQYPVLQHQIQYWLKVGIYTQKEQKYSKEKKLYRIQSRQLCVLNETC
jgi:hypothetical protein